jgi:hypothetical protein
MAKINAFNLKRPKRDMVTFIVQEPGEDQVLELSFISPVTSVLIEIGRVIEEKKTYYTTPILVDGVSAGIPELPYIEGIKIPYSEELIQLACSMKCLQADLSPENAYTVEDFVIFMEAFPTGMVSVMNWIEKATERFSSVTTNPTGAVIMPQSEVTLQGANGTPNLITDKTPCSGQSTKGSKAKKVSV